MALNIDGTFEGKLTCAFKNDMRNLASKFSPEHVQKSKIGTLMGSFYPKQRMYELKVNIGVLCHDNKESEQRGTIKAD